MSEAGLGSGVIDMYLVPKRNSRGSRDHHAQCACTVLYLAEGYDDGDGGGHNVASIRGFRSG